MLFPSVLHFLLGSVMSLYKLVQLTVLTVQQRGCFLATGLASLTPLKALGTLSAKDLGGVILDRAFD